MQSFRSQQLNIYKVIICGISQHMKGYNYRVIHNVCFFRICRLLLTLNTTGVLFKVYLNFGQ